MALTLIAREFLERFPAQKRFGRVAAEKALSRVMTQEGWTAEELLWRIRQWAIRRTTLSPWDLSQPLPRDSREETPIPAHRLAVPPVPLEWQGRASHYYEPFVLDDP